MTGAAAYLFIFLMGMMAVSCLLKLSCMSVRALAGCSVIWGVAGYAAIMIASETGNLQNGFFLRQGILFAVIFIECGMMIAYVFRIKSHHSKDVISCLLRAYPGVTILLPIAFGAVGFIRALTGVSFSALGIGYGIATAAIIFLGAFLIQKIKMISEIKLECIYLCAIATILTSIIICGLQN